MASAHDEKEPDSNGPDEMQQNALASHSGSSHSGGGIFEIRVKGHLDDTWLDWLEGLEMKRCDNGEMILTGTIVDQAALLGVLNKLNRLNLPLLSVTQVDQSDRPQPFIGGKMENVRALNQKLETVAWAAFFIWWGITELFRSLPPGIGALGIGVILLSLNAARRQNGLPTSGFTITLGILALVLGGLELASAILHLPIELPIFAILLIVLGMTVLGRSLIQNRSE